MVKGETRMILRYPKCKKCKKNTILHDWIPYQSGAIETHIALAPSTYRICSSCRVRQDGN